MHAGLKKQQTVLFCDDGQLGICCDKTHFSKILAGALRKWISECLCVLCAGMKRWKSFVLFATTCVTCLVSADLWWKQKRWVNLCDLFSVSKPVMKIKKASKLVCRVWCQQTAKSKQHVCCCFRDIWSAPLKNEGTQSMWSVLKLHLICTTTSEKCK